MIRSSSFASATKSCKTRVEYPAGKLEFFGIKKWGLPFGDVYFIDAGMIFNLGVVQFFHG